MSLYRGFVTLVISIFASVIAIVACGPTDGGSAVIRVSDNEKIVNSKSCVAKLTRYDARVDEKTVTVDGHAPTNDICQSPLGQVTNASGVAYKAASSPIRYSVSRKDDSLSIALKIGVVFPDGTPDETLKDSIRVLNDQCVKMLVSKWSQTQGHVALDISIENADYNSAYDQILIMIGSDLNPPTSFKTQNWPERGELVSKVSIDPVCARDWECRKNGIVKANARFCTTFALLTSQWLGLKSIEASQQCKPAQRPPTGAESISGGFMKAEGLQDSPAEFWSRAQFSRDDIKTILGPACDGKPVAPTKK